MTPQFQPNTPAYFSIKANGGLKTYTQQTAHFSIKWKFQLPWSYPMATRYAVAK
jgi:hypothetical protein